MWISMTWSLRIQTQGPTLWPSWSSHGLQPQDPESEGQLKSHYSTSDPAPLLMCRKDPAAHGEDLDGVSGPEPSPVGCGHLEGDSEDRSVPSVTQITKCVCYSSAFP